jgi:hypothetical protein
VGEITFMGSGPKIYPMDQLQQLNRFFVRTKFGSCGWILCGGISPFKLSFRLGMGVCNYLDLYGNIFLIVGDVSVNKETHVVTLTTLKSPGSGL